MANSVSGAHGVFQSGQKTVTTAGTAVTLTSSVEQYHSLTILALPGNTGQVYIGGADVASGTNGGLAPGDKLTITPARAHALDLSDIYIDVDTNGEGVDFYASY